MRKLRSLKARLALWVLLPTVLIAIVDLIVSFHGADLVATLVQDQLLRGSARIISEQLSSADGIYEINVPPAAFELFASRYQDRVFYSVRSRGGILIAGDAELAAYPAHLTTDEGAYFSAVVRGTPVRVVAFKHALPSSGSNDYAITQIAQSLQGHDAFRNELLAVTLRQHLFLLALVSIALVVAFRWTLRPLIELGETLRQRQPGTLARLDATDMPVELKPIVVSVNEYVSRLDNTLDAYEIFVANTAHHLRTSFAIVLSQVSFGKRDPHSTPAQRQILDAIQSSVTQGSKTINQLLVLASLDNDAERTPLPAPAIAPPIRPAAVVQAVMEELAPLAAQKDIELGIDAFDESAQVAAPAHLLREVVSNLLDNAIQHMGAGGSVTLSVFAGAAGVTIRIVDTGPGIAPHERTRVFDRFYRIDASRSNSSGLGLSIVRNICDTLGATVALATPADGTGLQVDVTLPAAESGSL